jgi:hypothetical protein
MTDPLSQDALDAQARRRFFAISLLRFSGVALVMLGIAIMMGRILGLEGALGRYVGLFVAFAGLLEFAIVPRLLAKRWASPAEEVP